MNSHARTDAIAVSFSLTLCSAMLLTVAVATGAVATEPSRSVVVLPKDPTPIERFAAEELRRCLLASMGGQVQIVEKTRPAKGNPVFWLGTVETPSRLAPFPSTRTSGKVGALIEDGVYLHGDGMNVILLGKGRRGALNAVYTFLEHCLGFHWPEPGQEFVPKPVRMKLNALDLLSNPAFPYRGIAIHGRCEAEWFTAILDWLAKNRMNGFQVFPGHYEQLRPRVLEEVLKRGLFPNIGGHSREFFFPAHKYFQEHPDWFALVKGKRVSDTQICYSNLDSVPEYVANVVSYLKTRPEIGMASLWPSDGYGFCECERCKSGHVTDVILGYINAVTRGVVAALPDRKTEFLSYIHYTVPPKDVRPEPQVVPTYCEYWSRSQFHPITEERSRNRKCREEMTAWIAASREATLFSYYGDDCIKWFLYNPIMDVISADMRYYRSIRLAGNFVLLTNPESWWSNAPHLYAYARAAWDPDTPSAQIEKDYYDSLYGPASAAMRAHAAACRALFEMKTAQGVTGEDVVWGQSLGNYDPAKDGQTRKQGTEAVARLRKCLDQAPGTHPRPEVLKRIQKLEAAAEYVGWVIEFTCELHRTSVEKTPEARQRLLALAESGLQLEILSEDDRLGYRSARNALLHTTRRLTGAEPAGAHGSVAALREYQAQGIWRWTTEDINPSSKEKPRRIVIDVTDRIKGLGTYQVVWQYLDGADGLSILSTGLCTADAAKPKPEDLKPIVIDEHEGFTGGGNSRNVYSLRLATHDPAHRYFILGVIYNQREFDTFGHVLLQRQGP